MYIIYSSISIYTYMSHAKKKFNLLPKISSNLNDKSQDHSLSRLSRELSTIDVNEQYGFRNKKSHSQKKDLRILSNNLKNEQKQLQQCKNQLKLIRQMVEKRQLQKSLILQNKLSRLQRIKTEQLSQSSTPRSVNFVSLLPPVQTPVNPYPPMMYPPYPSIYPPVQPPPPPQYNDRRERQSRYSRESSYYDDREYSRQSSHRRRRRHSKKYIRRKPKYYSEIPSDRILDQSYYDDYEQPQRYNKMRDSMVPRRYPQPYPQRFRPITNIRALMRKWKAHVWAILFAKKLPIFSQKIQKIRCQMHDKFQRRKFNTQMVMLQRYLVKKCQPFFVFLSKQKQFQLMIQSVQTNKMEKEKASIAKKLINYLIQGIGSINIADKNQPGLQPVQIIHLFCKHGSFTYNSYMTEQELDMVCFSQTNRYLRMDKNLQKSQIINFLCIKILLFNIILNPSKVDPDIFPADNEIMTKNFYFVGSIWYELCMEVQDEYLCSVPSSYQLANWRKFKQKHDITAVKSLSANGNANEQDQMVSGMLGKKKIQEIFGTSFWRAQKNKLKTAIQNLHQTVIQFHKKIKSNIKF